MICQKTILAIIPARGGSRRVAKKNIRPVGGKPLIVWTILEAKKSKYIDRLILSSEDPEIIAVARQWECEAPFVRPAELAQAQTPGVDPVIHALEVLPEKYDYVLLLQPTSPLRLAADIDGCLEKCCRQDSPSCVAVAEFVKSPYWLYTVDASERLRPFFEKPENQKEPKSYLMNGALYLAKTEWLQQQRTFLTPETTAYIMPPERSLDVDTEFDLSLCDLILSPRNILAI